MLISFAAGGGGQRHPANQVLPERDQGAGRGQAKDSLH